MSHSLSAYVRPVVVVGTSILEIMCWTGTHHKSSFLGQKKLFCWTVRIHELYQNILLGFRCLPDTFNPPMTIINTYSRHSADLKFGCTDWLETVIISSTWHCGRLCKTSFQLVSHGLDTFLTNPDQFHAWDVFFLPSWRGLKGLQWDYNERVACRLARVTSRFTVPPIPSHGDLPCDDAKKFQSAETLKSGVIQQIDKAFTIFILRSSSITDSESCSKWAIISSLQVWHCTERCKQQLYHA